MNLEHLDDPMGFTPDQQFREGALAAGRRRRRRRRLTAVVGVVTATVVLFASVVAASTLVRIGRIDRTELQLAADPVAPDRPFNVLLVGVDQRAPHEGGVRSDTMVLLRILPAERVIRTLPLPRDLAVEPLGGGTPTRLNEAYADGGAQRLVDTVEARLGVPVNAYVETDFAGLVDLVDIAGGLRIGVPADLRDEATGLDLAASSCTTIDGTTALQLLRSRHLEVRAPDGRWVSDASGDLGRVQRSSELLSVALPQIAAGIDGLGGAQQALGVAVDHVTVDSRLGVGQLAGVAAWLVDGPTPVVESYSLPVAPALSSAGAALLVLHDGAGDVTAALGGSAPDPGRLDGLTPSGGPSSPLDATPAPGGFACH